MSCNIFVNPLLEVLLCPEETEPDHPVGVAQEQEEA
jgi:hypothetical protein